MPTGRPTTQATIELQTDSEGEAPMGALLTSDGTRRSFSGWLELASAIEDWRQAADQPSCGLGDGAAQRRQRTR
jgi:hypothetical protein